MVWIVRSGQAESLRNTFHVGIDDDTGLAECIPEHDIRRFSTDARQGGQLVHCVRDLSAKALNHGLAAGDQMFGFILKETGGMNESFEFSEIGRRQRRRCSISLKE